jgi:hypothetical protein
MPTLRAMAEYFTEFKDWVISLGEKHGVDPLLLGCLYLVSKISLVFFLGWTVKNLRAKKPFTLQLLFAGISFCTPYTYIIIAGRNLPIWVYLFIGLIFVYGGFTIWKKIAAKQEAS